MTKEAVERQIHKNKVTGDIILTPLFYRALTYIVVLVFCFITLFSILWMVTLIQKEGFLSIGGIPVITFFAGYGSYVGLVLIRYIGTKISYDKDGFTIIKKGNSVNYPWSQIAKTKYYGIFNVLRLFDAEGKTMYTIQGTTKSNKKFIQKISSAVGYTSDVF